MLKLRMDSAGEDEAVLRLRSRLQEAPLPPGGAVFAARRGVFVFRR